METVNKWLTPLNTLLIVVMFVVTLVGGNQPAALGGTTKDDIRTTKTLTVDGASTLTGLVSFGTGGVKVGASASTITFEKLATCTLIDGTSVTASSTKLTDCAVTGVIAGDSISILSPTTTASGSFLGWVWAGATASSTSGFVTVALQNQTGAAAVPPTTATTSVVRITRFSN